MKLSKLTQAVSIALTALALSACGSSDDGGVIYNTDTTTPTPDTTPTTTPSTDADKLASIIAAAKAAGLNDANAQKFAEAVKELAQDSEAYANALAAALEAQKIEIENATKPVSETVKTHNPFIRGINTAEKLSSGSDFYTRHPGSTYDRGANAGDMAGLGGVAIDDPTGDNGNPWLSNFVLGVETVNGQVKAIDSTGEMALPVDGVNRGQKIGAAESWYAKRDGLRYNTDRTDKTTLVQRRYAAPRYPSGRFPFYSSTNIHVDANGNVVDLKAIDRASGLIENCTSAFNCVDGRAKDMAIGDYDYDYSAVHVAPRRNDGWQASDAKYINKTWEKWKTTSSDSQRHSWDSDGDGTEDAESTITTHSVVFDTDMQSKGDFDPWRDGEQWLKGKNHAMTTGGENCTTTTIFQDCYTWNNDFLRKVKGQADNKKSVTSARWTGERIYRHHYEFRANNEVDENEGAIINSTGAYSRAIDRNPHLSNDPIHNTTIDFVGRPASTGSAGQRLNRTYNYGLGLGHGSTYGTHTSVNANLEDAFGRKIYTIQEINRRKVKVSENAVTDAESFAKFVGTTAQFDAHNPTTSQAIHVNNTNGAAASADGHLRVNADPYYTIRPTGSGAATAAVVTTTQAIEDQRRYDTGLIVYNNHSKIVTGDEREYGYKKPIFGIEENVYIEDGDKLKVVNHIYDDELVGSQDSVKTIADTTKINNDKNSFFSVAKEKRMVYHQPCRGGITGQSGCAPYERKGYDWADDYSVVTGRGTSGNGDTKDGLNSWDELDFDNRNYNNPEGLDALNSGYGDGAFNVEGNTDLNDPTNTKGVTYDSILGVNIDTWRRMEQWRRLTVMRESRNPLETGVDAVKVANNLETRVYGKNYRDLETGATGFQETHNSYTGNFKTNKDADGNEIDHQMTKIAPAKLHHVQYGRITNNIDVLTKGEMDKVKDGDEARIIYRQFQEHGAPNSVDTYFYRGTNRTTMEQMEAIKARGGIINYRGHALTYNLGPIVEKADTIPTAYGTDNGATIGNFVQAKFDTATGKVDGSIYNFLNTDVSADANKFMRQDLVTFNGDVYGNTVTGTATKLGIKPEVGTLTASFYGESANELGGAVNSLTREQGYGDAKWGAVFGATRGTMVDQFNIIEASGNNQP